MDLTRIATILLGAGVLWTIGRLLRRPIHHRGLREDETAELLEALIRGGVGTRVVLEEERTGLVVTAEKAYWDADRQIVFVQGRACSEHALDAVRLRGALEVEGPSRRVAVFVRDATVEIRIEFKRDGGVGDVIRAVALFFEALGAAAPRSFHGFVELRRDLEGMRESYRGTLTSTGASSFKRRAARIGLETLEKRRLRALDKLRRRDGRGASQPDEALEP